MKGDWLFKFVPIFIGAVFVLVICGAVAYGVLIYKGVGMLQGCHPAIVSQTQGGQTSTTIACKETK